MADPAYVTELEKNYPRIVEKLALLWGHDGLSSYLGHLLIDERGDRHGFPPDIMAEIMFLDNLHEDMMREQASESGSSLWENPLVKSLKS